MSHHKTNPYEHGSCFCCWWWGVTSRGSAMVASLCSFSGQGQWVDAGLGENVSRGVLPGTVLKRSLACPSLWDSGHRSHESLDFKTARVVRPGHRTDKSDSRWDEGTCVTWYTQPLVANWTGGNNVSGARSKAHGPLGHSQDACLRWTHDGSI